MLQVTLMLVTTEPAMHGRALGLLELAIGIMPIASLGLGVFAERFGIDHTTFVSAVALVAIMVLLTMWTPRLLRYSGHDTKSHAATPPPAPADAPTAALPDATAAQPQLP